MSREQIAEKFDEFSDEIIPELEALLKKKAHTRKPENVFQMANAPKLSAANAITRTFNTKLGLFWERLAILSPNVVSPEIDLDDKTEGVDVIVRYQGRLYYTQLKTQKNTLTGSQQNRTIEELNRYRHKWFVACIENHCSSTMPRNQLPCLVGREFWDKIGIEYEVIEKNLKDLVQRIEQLLES